jgi:hypothetical protein
MSSSTILITAESVSTRAIEFMVAMSPEEGLPAMGQGDLCTLLFWLSQLGMA